MEIEERLSRLERRLQNLADFASWTTAAVLGQFIFHAARNWGASGDTATVIGAIVFIFSGMWFRNLATK